MARPTAAEADYIHGEAVRFAELRTDLLDPQFASIPFLAWLQARVVERHGPDAARRCPGRGSSRTSPALADAAVRLHTAGLLPMPDGARVREQHRRRPTADDWVALIGDYCRRCLLPSADPRDGQAYEAIRRALPSVGYGLTRAGVRAVTRRSTGCWPVRRARPAASPRSCAPRRPSSAPGCGRWCYATSRGRRRRCGPAARRAARPTAGGARLALRACWPRSTTAGLDPVLMTGRQVACGAAPRAGSGLAAARSRRRACRPPRDAAGGGAAVARSRGGAAGSRAATSRWSPGSSPGADPVPDRHPGAARRGLGRGRRQRRGRPDRGDEPTSWSRPAAGRCGWTRGWPGKVADNWGVACVDR